MPDTSDAKDTQKIERAQGDAEKVPTETPKGTTEPTLSRPPVEASAPHPAADPAPAPGLRDVTGTLGGYVRGRAAVVAAFVRRHRAASLVLALLAVAAVVCLALAFDRAGSLPGAEQIERDAREALATPVYEAGTYGYDDALVLREVDVRSVTRSATTPEGGQPRFGASGYADAEVVAAYEGSHVLADQAATLRYACVDGTWELIGGADDAQVAWRPLTGVDQERVLTNARLLLERAGEGTGDGTALVGVYEGATTEVTRDSFDPDSATDELVVACERSDAFESYSCELTASFSFDSASGRWTLGTVGVSDDALERNLDPLLGTWVGTFRSQETDGTKCLAGRKAGLVVSVTGAGTDTLTGTVSGVGHYHDHTADDIEGYEGDLSFEEVPFTARLTGDEGLTFVADLPEDVDGSVSLTLTFGEADDPSRVSATVETSFSHTGSILFIPYDETIVYSDLFTLTRDE